MHVAPTADNYRVHLVYTIRQHSVHSSTLPTGLLSILCYFLMLLLLWAIMLPLIIDIY